MEKSFNVEAQLSECAKLAEEIQHKFGFGSSNSTLGDIRQNRTLTIRLGIEEVCTVQEFWRQVKLVHRTTSRVIIFVTSIKSCEHRRRIQVTLHAAKPTD